MTSPRSRFAARRTPRIASIMALTAMIALSACGSDSDSAASGSSPADVSVVASEVATVSSAPSDSSAGSGAVDTTTGDTSPADTAPSGGGTGDASAVCGGLSGADVGAAAAVGDFDAADDISVDTDVTCLFSNSSSVFGITVSTESTATYLAGELEGMSIDDALASLESTQTLFLEEGYVVERVTVGGAPGIVVTGLDGIQAQATGYAATVLDGVVYQITASGTELATDAAGFSPIVTAVLELAVGAQA